MEKNVAGKWIVFAFEDEGGTNPGEPVTGDAGQITANISIDGAAGSLVGSGANPTELEDGYYVFSLTASETNGDLLTIFPQSATGNVNVIGVPGAVWTTPPNFNTLGIETDGDLTQVNTLENHTAQTGDTYALANGTSGFDAIDTVVDNIFAQIGTAGANLTDLGGMSNAMKAEVNNEVVDTLTTDTYAEPISVPAATSSLKDKIGWLFTLSRNKLLQTSNTSTVRNDADGADIATAGVSDDGTTFTRNEYS